eukprot:TRINITY_DN73404_c0_g1_i1.p1 TRINITY_DN73404_c0_g1~~TRINITY_DN73404_c0_g1_i1.p1  ORF type:complete len:338 (-),score=24.16 TRINITY_DN73404_c0_g1_i1:690-1703(-)
MMTLESLRSRVSKFEGEAPHLSLLAADDEGTKILVDLDSLSIHTNAEREQRRALIKRVENLLEGLRPTHECPGLRRSSLGNPGLPACSQPAPPAATDYDEDNIIRQLHIAGNALVRYFKHMTSLALCAARFREDALFRARLRAPAEEAISLVERFAEVCQVRPELQAAFQSQLGDAQKQLAKASAAMEHPESEVPSFWWTQFLDIIEKHAPCSSTLASTTAANALRDSKLRTLLEDFASLKQSVREDIAFASNDLSMLKEQHSVLSLLKPGSWTEEDLNQKSVRELMALCKLYGIPFRRGSEKQDLLGPLREILCRGGEHPSTQYSLSHEAKRSRRQ